MATFFIRKFYPYEIKYQRKVKIFSLDNLRFLFRGVAELCFGIVDVYSIARWAVGLSKVANRQRRALLAKAQTADWLYFTADSPKLNCSENDCIGFCG